MKKCAIVLFVMLLFLMVYCLGTVLGYDIILINPNKPIGLESPSGTYRLLELHDKSGNYVLYSIVQTAEKTEPQTLFVTQDLWCINHHIKEANWLGDSNDFYVYSYDTGIHIYRYRNGTWCRESGPLSQSDKLLLSQHL